MGVMGGLGIAQNLLGYAGNRQQAAQQNAYMAARQARESKAIEAGYRMTLRQASERYSQERAAVASQIQQVSGESRKAVAMSEINAAERGVQGASIDAVFNDFERTELEFVDKVLQNLEFKEQAIADQIESARLGAQANISNLAYMPQQGPSFAATLLGMGTSALNAYAMFREPTAPTPKPPPYL